MRRGALQRVSETAGHCPLILADRLERFVVDVVARNTKAMARYKAALRRRR
jgi:hypothetical protein